MKAKSNKQLKGIVKKDSHIKGRSIIIAPELFWEYSLNIYKDEKVKDACLFLQDHAGLNVNLILLLTYLSEQQLILSFEDLEGIETALERSEKLLKHHRRKRKGLKKINQVAYKQALADELDLERGQQQELLEAANGCFFNRIQSPLQLSDFLTALCINKRTKSPYYDPDNAELTLPKSLLDACTELAKVAENRFFDQQNKTNKP
uniref:TIGR02444 family protein n=1 Tax=Ningiella ruwaisensis TaxID=2364274 RepID=UPI00109F0BE3|nr:TIGR02444 family protein [Ningiella ruwaisensis]